MRWLQFVGLAMAVSLSSVAFPAPATAARVGKARQVPRTLRQRATRAFRNNPIARRMRIMRVNSHRFTVRRLRQKAPRLAAFHRAITIRGQADRIRRLEDRSPRVGKFYRVLAGGAIDGNRSFHRFLNAAQANAMALGRPFRRFALPEY